MVPKVMVIMGVAPSYWAARQAALAAHLIRQMLVDLLSRASPAKSQRTSSLILDFALETRVGTCT